MPEEIRLWKIDGGDQLTEVTRSSLDLESRLESWLERDIGILDPELLVIGRQVATDFGGCIDLLCIDRDGDLAVVELKRDKTPREITAQVLDYGSWIQELSSERISAVADAFLGAGKLEEKFRARFAAELPETINAGHRLLVVGSEIDNSSERIIRYLSGSYGVNINAATFRYFKADGGEEFLGRVFLIEPERVEQQSRSSSSSKRRPNLTHAELEALAEERGVGELYRYFVHGLETALQKQTTRSSIAFAASLDGSRKVVVSAIPEKSTDTAGLFFQVYSHRLQKFLNRSEADVLALLPARRERWAFMLGGPDYQGFQGFFANREEIERFLSAIRQQEGSNLPLSVNT